MSTKNVFIRMTLKDSLSSQMKGVAASIDKTGKAVKDLGFATDHALKLLGTKSDATYRKMEADAQQAYNRIKASATTSTAEQQRALRGLTQELAKLKSQQTGVAIATDKTANSMTGLSMVLVKNYLAYLALQTAMSGVAAEFRKGFSAVEDYKGNVANIAAMVATFSKQAQTGDFAGAFKNAYEYSEKIVLALEKMDAQSVASGEDLKVMFQAFARNGVLLDEQNEKQKRGFLGVAAALKVMFANTSNATLQYNQEIEALMTGQARQGDKLIKMLKVSNPDLEANLILWRQKGTVLENILPMVEAYNLAAQKLEGDWAVVGSTLDTIHTRILREGFKPVVEDILSISISIKDALLDANSELTPFAKSLQEGIKSAYAEAKDLAGITAGMAGGWMAVTAALTAYKIAIGEATVLTAALARLNPWIVIPTAAAGGFVWMKQRLQELTEEMLKQEEGVTALGEKWSMLQAPEGWDPEKQLRLLEIKKIIDEINDVKKNGIKWELFESPDRIAERVASLTDELNKLLGVETAQEKMVRQLVAAGEFPVKKAPPALGISETPKQVKARLDAVKSYQDTLEKAVYGAMSEYEQKIYDIEKAYKAQEASLEGLVMGGMSMARADELQAAYRAKADRELTALEERRRMHGPDRDDYLAQQAADFKAAQKASEEYAKSMDAITRASLPDQERALYDIQQRYAALENQLVEQVDLYGMSMAEADAYQAAFAARMSEELTALSDKTEETATDMSEFWKTAYGNMQDVGASFFKSMREGSDDYLKNFSDMVLNMVDQWMAAKAMMAMVGDPNSGKTGLLQMAAGAAISYLGGKFGAVQGPINAPPDTWHAPMVLPEKSYAVGTDYVPYDMVARIHKGERIIPAAQNRPGVGASVQVNVINNASGTQAKASERSDGNGGRIIDVMIEQIKGAIASDISRGDGSIPAAMSRTYGLNRAAGAY